MDKYIHGSNSKLLSDIMSSGFEENDACFINWEKLTKKGNNALKDSERTNFVEHIQNAIDNGLTFTIIVDESHQNDTIKADDILALFNANKIIRCSATPKNYKNALLIEIPEEDVIAEGLIKKLLIINENFEQHISVEDQISYLLDKALEKQRDLRAAYAKKDSGVNPLIIVQLPNKSDALLDRVEEYFESKGITFSGGKPNKHCFVCALQILIHKVCKDNGFAATSTTLQDNIPIGLSHSFHKGLNGFKLKICKRDPHIYPSNSL